MMQDQALDTVSYTSLHSIFKFATYPGKERGLLCDSVSVTVIVQTLIKLLLDVEGLLFGTQSLLSVLLDTPTVIWPL